MEEPREDALPRARFSSVSFLIGFGSGCFLGVAFALMAIALVREPVGVPSGKVSISGLDVGVVNQPTPVPDNRPRTRSELDVRLGPGLAFAVVGVMARGDPVEIVGRDADSEWVAVQFPPGSAGLGWLPAAALVGGAGLDGYAVVLPTPLPRLPSFPEASPVENESGEGSVTPPSGTPTSIVTPAPRDSRVDLVVEGVTRLSDGSVQVLVGNHGPGDITNELVVVLVRDLAIRREQILSSRPLRAGATITVQTSRFRVEREMALEVVIDPSTTLNDHDRSNNSRRVTLSPPPTPTPTATPTPTDDD